MTEYIIVGDTKNYGTCLMRVLKGYTKEQAEKYLAELLANPDESFKKDLKTHKNPRIQATEEKEQWWNDPFLAN